MKAPVTAGVPLPLSLDLSDPAAFKLVDANGEPVPAQFTPLARWGAAPDNPSAPIRWLLLDFQTSPGAKKHGTLYTTGAPAAVHVALPGKQRAPVEVRGSFMNGSSTLFDYTAR